ncbi:hypothetical protein [Sorangium sp. So ce426]
MQHLHEINGLLREVATTLVTATTIIGATVALVHSVRRLFRRSGGPQS